MQLKTSITFIMKNWDKLMSFIAIIISIYSIILTKKQKKYKYDEQFFSKYQDIIIRINNYNFDYVSNGYDNIKLMLKMYNEIALINNDMRKLINETKLLKFKKNIIEILEKQIKLTDTYCENLFFLKNLLKSNQTQMTLDGGIIISQEECKKECEKFQESSIQDIGKLYKEIQKILNIV